MTYYRQTSSLSNNLLDGVTPAMTMAMHLYCQLREPMTLSPVAERVTVELPLPVPGFEHLPFPLLYIFSIFSRKLHYIFSCVPM